MGVADRLDSLKREFADAQEKWLDAIDAMNRAQRELRQAEANGAEISALTEANTDAFNAHHEAYAGALKAMETLRTHVEGKSLTAGSDGLVRRVPEFPGDLNS